MKKALELAIACNAVLFFNIILKNKNITKVKAKLMVFIEEIIYLG